VRSLAKLDGELGIRVTAVAPGVVKTPIWTENISMIKEGVDMWVTPEEVAEVMLALIQQNEVSEIIGDTKSQGKAIPIGGGTILEVTKKVRAVHAFNDPGPSGPGATITNIGGMEQKIYGLLSQANWGISQPGNQSSST
jgi:3-hydroxybutyrate dehydrogenase